MSYSCNPRDSGLPGSSVHGISQARIEECGLPFLSLGDLPDAGIEARSPALQADSSCKKDIQNSSFDPCIASFSGILLFSLFP